MGEYDSAVALAKRLIQKKGRTVSFLQLDGTPADPDKPWQGAGTPAIAAQVTQRAVFLPISSADDLGFTLDKDELNTRRNELLLVAPGTMDLTLVHEVVDVDGTFGILWIKVLRPGDAVVLYAMGLKQ